VSLIHLAEEFLINFRELIGEHSGENMVPWVWETIEKSGPIGRVRPSPSHTYVQLVSQQITTLWLRRLHVAAELWASHSPAMMLACGMQCIAHTIHLAALKIHIHLPLVFQNR
jgi:hypothetical protein